MPFKISHVNSSDGRFLENRLRHPNSNDLSVIETIPIPTACLSNDGDKIVGIFRKEDLSHRQVLSTKVLDQSKNQLKP